MKLCRVNLDDCHEVDGLVGDYIRKSNPFSVTFVETGVHYRGSGDEDVACADYMTCLLKGTQPNVNEISAACGSHEAHRSLSATIDRHFPEEI